MTKTEKNASKTQDRQMRRSKAHSTEPANVNKAPPSETRVDKEAPTEKLIKGQEPKSSKELAPSLTDEERQVLRRVGAQMLSSSQVEATVAISCSNDKVVDLALKQGAQGLVDEFAPTDAVESTLAPVIVGIRNAVMTGLRLATTTGSCERRDIELGTALKGAGVLAQLLEAFDAHRGHGHRRVTVGNVNVESGAQAIVGNVETTSRPESQTEDSTVEPKKPNAGRRLGA